MTLFPNHFNIRQYINWVIDNAPLNNQPPSLYPVTVTIRTANNQLCRKLRSWLPAVQLVQGKVCPIRLTIISLTLQLSTVPVSGPWNMLHVFRINNQATKNCH